MLLRDLTLYRALLQKLSLGDLILLYERTLGQQPTLARVIGDELDRRLTLRVIAER